MKNVIAVVLPSMMDNLPNTCIESMSLDRIVVGTYDGGFEQLITDEKNGFLVRYGDDEEFLKAIAGICSMSKSESDKIGGEAKKSIKGKLNYDDRLGDLINFYKKAINEFSE